MGQTDPEKRPAWVSSGADPDNVESPVESDVQSLISGPLLDGGWFKSTVAVGAVFITVGFMMTSLASQYWQLILSQGLCIGLGAGCMVVPSLSILPQYFLKKRALATGITVCGSSLGGVIYPLIFQALVDKVGFAWTNRIMGFIALVTCSFSAFREPAYVVYCFGMFCSNFGFFPPIFYLQTYALGHGLTDRNIALNLVAILNAASIVGRLAPSPAVRMIGPINTMMIVLAMASLVAFSWIAVHTGPGNIVFAVMYGFTSGGIVSLPAVVLASITEDLSFMGARLGTSNFINALASLCGAPIAGVILKSTGKYLGVQLFSGLFLFVAASSLFMTRIARVGLSQGRVPGLPSDAKIAKPLTTIETLRQARLNRDGKHDHGIEMYGGGRILETVGTAFYVYVSGNIATTLGSYDTSQTGGYVGFGNIALLSIFVYATASATGGHLNPLITFSAIIAGICPVSRGILYLAGQALGGAIAGGVLTGVYGRERSIEVHGGGCYFDSGSITSGQVFLNESFACFAYVFLSFGVGLDPKQGVLFGPRLAPLLTGGVLGLMTFATSGTVPGYPGAQMNPARCFGYGIARRDMSGKNTTITMGEAL
ncbi:unnamed protein product [Parascedosporium putredinis]|uniref:Major facilitator superfamily (MFS) profile domain-containing protein n=1 Tax=Parascedosporium putredinis TaxID=1442378 RepID=A0A9P1M9G8_9PEZI|nr:unnamed protein product [Parascedosporium putredinis]CAI7991936.1 unnamed protein product [Parascedosporium putredinis]